MKQSRMKRLVPRNLAQRLARASEADRGGLERDAEREAAGVIASMRAKGYRLVTRLETGEGVFVREDDLVALHVQLPAALYRRLEKESGVRETSKRKLVIAALEEYLGRAE